MQRRYNTTLRTIIPLPDPNAPPDSAAHLNAYPEFSAGSTVMALYPDTSCFYRAEVIASPRDLGRVSIRVFSRGHSIQYDSDSCRDRRRSSHRCTSSSLKMTTTKSTWCRLCGWSSGRAAPDVLPAGFLLLSIRTLTTSRPLLCGPYFRCTIIVRVFLYTFQSYFSASVGH